MNEMLFDSAHVNSSIEEIIENYSALDDLRKEKSTVYSQTEAMFKVNNSHPKVINARAEVDKELSDAKEEFVNSYDSFVNYLKSCESIEVVINHEKETERNVKGTVRIAGYEKSREAAFSTMKFLRVLTELTKDFESDELKYDNMLNTLTRRRDNFSANMEYSGIEDSRTHHINLVPRNKRNDVTHLQINGQRNTGYHQAGDSVTLRCLEESIYFFAGLSEKLQEKGINFVVDYDYRR